MKPNTMPMICGLALAAMTAAGFSHWWSVRQFVAAIQTGLPVLPQSRQVAQPAYPAGANSPVPILLTRQIPPNPAPFSPNDADQKKFYEALIAKLESFQNQNRDLRDQIAETNRDVLNLGFRVDTHSESFRPMPVSEDRGDTSFDNGPGVLPPRAGRVFSATNQ